MRVDVRGAGCGVRGAALLGLACLMVLASSQAAWAQIDPLLFLKNTKPNVLLVVDTSNRMQRDANNDYYDQFIYTRGEAWDAPLGVTAANTAQHYRRKYVGLAHLDWSIESDRFGASTITIVGDRQPGFATFDARTRLGVARIGLARAIALNARVVRFGLIKMRQQQPTFGTMANEGPVRNSDPNQQSPTDGSGPGKWSITRPTVSGSNSAVFTETPPLYRPDAAGANTNIATLLARAPYEGGLLPAGTDTRHLTDAPVKYMLDDAKAEAVRLINADSSAGIECRNTVVVLVAGGAEGSLSGLDPTAVATAFRSISGRRVPVYVIAVAPPATAVSQLRAIAANSGGQYLEVTKAMIDAVPQGTAVPEVVRGVNTAIQHAFASATDVNATPTVSPFGPTTEFQVTSPIIGTVNLANANDINGNPLANSVITLASGNVIPQRSNVLLTTGFALPGTVDTPGFPGRLRAFRVYRPVPDATRTSGYKFVGDGTALWVARTPTAGEGSRNIYTVLPDGTMVAFTSGNAAALAPYLNDLNPADLIDYIRNLPIGAFIDSTPAILDPPSLDPPPDPTYPGFLVANKGRRSLIFIGGNDGMMHAIDARTGVEAWAFIPSNLLPKLRALREGLAVGKFEFTADGSAKLADIRTPSGWRSYLIFGEGPGGTFYQALDVTMDGMAAAVSQESDDVSAVLDYFSAASRVPFVWSFPSYSSFDYTLSTSVTPYGDLKSTASTVEKSVGQSWSDPAVGAIQDATGNYAMMVGSGFLPWSQQHQANRGDTIAGTTFYLVDAVTGSILDSRDVGDDGSAETVDDCSVVNDCRRLKNALQSDPVATGPPNSRFVSTAYMGDLDGRLWRFGITLVSGTARITSGPLKLFDAGNTHPLVSSMAVVNVGGTKQYVFFGSGSDLLPGVGVSQSYKLFGIQDPGTGSAGIKTFERALGAVSGAEGERVSAFPAVAGDIVFFTTTTFSSSACSAGDANVYALTFIGGAAYDSTGDDKVDKKDTPKVMTLIGAGRATAPFVSDQHLVLAAGGKVQFFGDPQDFNNGVGQVGVRILSWREIR